MRRIVSVLSVAAIMAAMMVMMAAPAMAVVFDFDDNDFNHFNFNGGTISNGVDQESESGDIENNFSVSNTGDYAFQCTPAIQFGNTGNFNNGSSFVQFGSLSDDFEPEGIEFSFEPEQTTDCSNTIQQSSAADSSSWWWY